MDGRSEERSQLTNLCFYHKKNKLEKWRTQGTQCKRKEENSKDHEENNEIEFNRVPGN